LPDESAARDAPGWAIELAQPVSRARVHGRVPPEFCMANLLRLPTFVDDDMFHVVVESPRGSSVKLKYDGALEVMSISRPLALGLSYPFDWGFVPSTEGPDGDPIDALVFWDVATFPGLVIPCRALALVQVEQDRKGHSGQRTRNDRVIAVPEEDRRAIADTPDALPARVRKELEHFFVAATVFEGKNPTVLGWKGAAAALALIRDAARSTRTG
jgi:inorganic pyrophosphatase